MSNNVDMRSLRDILLKYCEKGWFLFPIKRETKRPAIKDNLKSASNDIEQLMQWAEKFPNCNWGVSLAKSGMVAVDIDEKGLDKWGALVVHNGEPQTLKQKSGSGIGSHFVFKAEHGKKYRGKIDDGIDVKHNGYIAIFPSIHERTRFQYKWENEAEPQTPPPWIKALIEKETLAPGKRSPVYKFGSGFYHKIVQQLKEKAFGYNEWLRLGMALHSAFNGSDEGLELYLDLTEGVNFKSGDLEQAKYKWETFKADGGASAGTFVFIARDLGCDIPNPQFENDKELFAKAMTEEEQKDLEETPKWNADKYDRLWTAHIEFLVKELNDQGYATLSGDQEGTIIKTWHDENGLLRVKQISLPNFKTALAPYHLKAYVPGADGVPRPKLIPAADMWIKSSLRKQFTEIVFRPNAPEGALNLWTDIPCVRKGGNVAQFLAFIEDVLCAGDKLKAKYLIQWQAQLVQFPHIKSTVVPVLVGEEGTGKGFFTDGLLRGILKNYYCRIDKAGVIMERFNAEQARKFLTVLDEAAWRGNHALMDLLKSLTGNDTMTVEEKFGGRFTIENFSRYIVTTNNREALMLSTTNRRFLILDVSSKFIQDADYYGNLWKSLEEGGLEAWFDYLMQVDLSDFNPKQFPKEIDTGGLTAKISSHGTVSSFWWNSMFEEPMQLFESKMNCTKPLYFMRKARVYEMFVEFAERTRAWEKGISPEKFWRMSKDLIPRLKTCETRPRFGDGNRERLFELMPYDLAENFCQTLRIAIPESFDDLEVMADPEFTEVPEAQKDRIMNSAKLDFV